MRINCIHTRGSTMKLGVGVSMLFGIACTTKLYLSLLRSPAGTRHGHSSPGQAIAVGMLD